VRSCISTTMLPMSQGPGRPGSRPIQSARRPTCAPASRFTSWRASQSSEERRRIYHLRGRECRCRT
jgi:hypothetical protein